MSRDFAWQLFKNTGNVDAFMIMRNDFCVNRRFRCTLEKKTI